MIEVRNITKTFGVFRALDDVSLLVPKGKLVALLGPSGSGKTTLLRILAGLDAPDHGTVILDGVEATERKARDRGIGFVFQHYALFRHMTVADNIAFGLTVRKGKDRPPRAEIDRRVAALLDLVQLSGLAGRYPTQLSGGQRQRVALARALAVEPRLLLLDEPFGALDAQVRKELRRWLRRLHDELGLTGVFVTHDQEEALEVADEVVVMNKGRIEQIGSPAAIYDSPATPFVFSFLGHVNALSCYVKDGATTLFGRTVGVSAPDGAAIAFIRPHDIVLVPPVPGQPYGVVRQISVLGPVVRIDLDLPGDASIETELSRDAFSQLVIDRGATVSLTLRRVRVFVGTSGPWEGETG
ncbi:sulfate/molybdate ABC transporter ATP-binding protein [Magnetospirillum molischianum]|uniref:Sulfate/thiosulfate ABC transporter, ATP-binding component n=1 Tax=Magnetospirillum molischianum DSM 120 TaxID=1150626 RepID=H8FNS8_MAGML|nr:sulfate ABC transporter ATP-binding protein [Magnetospirillum molischianum]CCG40016.1 sulfate/thiosulfate ABC transporter, ATP-binding component [Magnetospirillum molischianum DSM 120]